MSTDQQPGAPGAPPGSAPLGGDWLNGFLGALVSPAQMMATVQQLNYNLEMLQGGVASVDRLNTNLERMAPEIKRLTDALTTFAERMWGQAP